MEGELDKSLKFRLLRDNECLLEDLRLTSLKKFKSDVDKVEHGQECGG